MTRFRKNKVLWEYHFGGFCDCPQQHDFLDTQTWVTPINSKNILIWALGTTWEVIDMTSNTQKKGKSSVTCKTPVIERSMFFSKQVLFSEWNYAYIHMCVHFLDISCCRDHTLNNDCKLLSYKNWMYPKHLNSMQVQNPKVQTDMWCVSYTVLYNTWQVDRYIVLCDSILTHKKPHLILPWSYM